MVSASRYWRLVRLDSTGKRRVEEVSIVKTFFQDQFLDGLEQADLTDAAVQRQLLRFWREGSGELQELSHRCLRCFISNQIEQVCIDLEKQFGIEHGFTRYDLFALVLDDDGRRAAVSRAGSGSSGNGSSGNGSSGNGSTSTGQSVRYQSLAEQTLQTFDPERAGLSTWVSRMVKHHRELNQFLLEHGVYLVSDWAILNDTNARQLERIFREFHKLSENEIQQAVRLLECYHAVYRQDRLQQRQSGGRGGSCQPPNREQLARIAQLLGTSISDDRLLAQLQGIATRLRQYRIAVRGGTLPTKSLDQPEMKAIASELPAPEEDDEEQENRNAFLKEYRQQVQESLDAALEQVIGDRLKKMKPPKDQHFLLALQLFHSEGRSMGEIAPHVGLREQYQVTRLMKLKDLRTDVRQRMLMQLRDRLRELAARYADPDQLEQLDRQLEAALEEQINPLFQQAEAETNTARNRPLESLFSLRLRHYLDSRSA